MRTFCISTFGCKVNQYESEQMASLLRSHGLRQVERPDGADLRIVNTCSVTIQAASKSRQTVRQAIRLPVLASNQSPGTESGAGANIGIGGSLPTSRINSRTIVTG